MFYLLLAAGINTGLVLEGHGDGGGLKFIENKNQWPSSIIYSAQLPSGVLYLRKNAFQYFLYDKGAVADLHMQSHENRMYENSDELCFEQIEIPKHQYLVNFINSNDDVEISGEKSFPEYYNYFTGRDSSRWASRSKAYQVITYKELYDGIDMRVYSSDDDPKYDLIVHPGSESNQISLEYVGLDDVYIFEGDLVMETSLGIVREQKPYAYQDIGGVRVPVTCNYVLDCDVLSFEFPESYNKSYPIVIDPLLIFSTYSGSKADNWGNTATPGERGTLYSGGITNHFRRFVSFLEPTYLGEFPATKNAYQTRWGGIWDVAIIKYDSTGSKMKYATYLGGSGSEVPHSMIMDHDENLIIMGSTNSVDFPVTSGVYQTNFQGGTFLSTIISETFTNGSDIFVAKLSKDGDVLREATYFGGDGNDGQNRPRSPLNRNHGDQQRGEVFIDDKDNIYIASITRSTRLFDDVTISSFDRTYNGGESDGILVKFNPTLEKIIWGGYLGGSGTDAALAVKINKAGEVYVAGGTNSFDFDTSGGGLHQTIQGEEDGFVALIDKAGTQIMKATYLGTSSYDQVYFMDIGENEDVYLLGQTRGNYPVTAGTFNNAGGGQFIHKLTSDLSKTVFSTVFGTVGRREPNISPTAFLVSECDNIYVAGWGDETVGVLSASVGHSMKLNTHGLPVTSDAIRTTTNGNDFYLMVLDTDAKELLYATFFGGSSHLDGGTSRFDKRGIVYHAVCASCGGSSNFTTTSGAWSRKNGSGSGCNNAAFKFDLASLRARIQTNTTKFDSPGILTQCFPEPIVFENISIGGVTYQWDFGDGTSQQKSDKTHIVHTYQNPGNYTVTLTAIDQNTCVGTDKAQVTVNIFKNVLSVMEDANICAGTQLRLAASGGTDYTWFNSDMSMFASEQFPIVMPDHTTKYYVKIVDVHEKCELLGSVTVNVTPPVKADFEVSRKYNCKDVPKVTIVNNTENASQYTWIFGDGTTSSESIPVHDYKSGVYQLTLKAANEICHDEKTITIDTRPIKTYNVITPGLEDGANDFFEVQSPTIQGLTIFNRWGKIVFKSDNYQNDWSAEGESSGVYYYELSASGKQVCKGWVHVLK